MTETPDESRPDERRPDEVDPHLTDDPTIPDPTGGLPPPPPSIPPPVSADPALPGAGGEDGEDDDDEDDDEEYADDGPRRRRFLSGGRLLVASVIVLLLLGGGAALALTGGGDDENDPGGDQDDAQQSMEDAALEFAQCMREHGIDMADPQVDGNGGIAIGGPADRSAGGDGPESVTPQDREEMEAAQEACQDILDEARPEGQQLTPDEVAERQDQALAMAQCMRDKGWENFPDPVVDEDGGIQIRMDADNGLPRPGDPNADQFQQDQEDCSEESGLGQPGQGTEGGLSSGGGDT